ncbi:MAG: glutamate racemase [Candidatus Eisenbacteria bacterium]|nr:glutamate racemase [Candidatus Eisenbacteria bacterium]
MSSSASDPIGVFDSGIGGLTVVAEIIRQLPNEEIVYFGDTARLPYGPKSTETVTQFAIQDAELLLRHSVKNIVVACNTASAIAIGALRERYDIPVIGVIEPGALAAVSSTLTGKIGVIGTEGTIASGAYRRAIMKMDRDIEVIEASCPLFVPLAEEGWTDREVTLVIAHEYLTPLRDAGVDVVVLGCTHYPILKNTIGKVFGPSVRLIDSAEETAKEVAERLDGIGLRRKEGAEPGHTFLVSDVPHRFREQAERFLGSPLGDVSLVSVDEIARAAR